MAENKKQRVMIVGATVAYFLIGIEIIIMISPFALYFYSVYGPFSNSFPLRPV